MECGDGDLLLPFSQSTPASVAASVSDDLVLTKQHTTANKLFLETCQRAAQRLGVEWPHPRKVFKHSLCLGPLLQNTQKKSPPE